MTAELHCHSFFSIDAWAAPEKIAEMAAAAGVATLSLTDHNSLEGLARARAHAEKLGLRFIDGVELDVKWRGDDYHALAFGFDPQDPEMGRISAHNWAQYQANFERWAPIIERRFGVTREELRADLPNRYPDHAAPVLNKWHARGYMIEKGIFPDREAALREMREVGTEAEGHLPNEEVWPFSTLEETRDAVHAAGGILLLAHVGGSAQTLDGQLELINGMLAAGLDGFELYHGSNTRYEHFKELVAEARRLGCAVSGGSDGHAHPAHPAHAGSSIGRTEVPDWVLETIDAALERRRITPD